MSVGLGEDDKVIEDIVSVGQSMGLETDSDDVEELLEEHCGQLTTEELVQLQHEQKMILAEEMSSEE